MKTRYKISLIIAASAIIYILFHSASLVIRITSDNSGKLVIDIPRNLLDMRYEDKDKEFIVLLDGEETDFDETSHVHSREYKILLPAGSKEIEIIGTFSLAGDRTTVSCETIHNPPYSHILPPLKQIKNNIHPEDVICEPNLVKVYKSSLINNPACVKVNTKHHLMERGWESLLH